MRHRVRRGLLQADTEASRPGRWAVGWELPALSSPSYFRTVSSFGGHCTCLPWTFEGLTRASCKHPGVIFWASVASSGCACQGSLSCGDGAVKSVGSCVPEACRPGPGLQLRSSAACWRPGYCPGRRFSPCSSFSQVAEARPRRREPSAVPSVPMSTGTPPNTHAEALERV